jgi:hypothetical protein
MELGDIHLESNTMERYGAALAKAFEALRGAAVAVEILA